jgi:hypothetical protein
MAQPLAGTAIVMVEIDALRRVKNGPRQPQHNEEKDMNRSRQIILTLAATVLGIWLVSSGASAQKPVKPSPVGPLAYLRAGDDSTYDAFLVSIKVRETKANGSSWDPAGGKPDLRVIISNERSGKTFISDVAKDTLSVNFDLKGPILDVAEGDILDFLVYDEDLADHDIVGLSKKAITSGILAKQQLDMSFGQVEQLRLEFRPEKGRAASR